MSFNVQSVKDFITVASSVELTEIRTALDNEVAARRLMMQMRDRWTEQWYLKFLAHPNAMAKVIDTTTVVALYNRSTGLHIATARCMPGDTYDENVGIAVAFAKLCNEPIPDYV